MGEQRLQIVQCAYSYIHRLTSRLCNLYAQRKCIRLTVILVQSKELYCMFYVQVKRTFTVKNSAEYTQIKICWRKVKCLICRVYRTYKA